MNSSAKDRLTLDRVLSKWGICSRTDAVRIIKSGAISVNRKVVRDPNQWVSLSHDQIRYRRENLSPKKKIYVMFYKPKGVVTTHRDRDNRRTVYDFFSEFGHWIIPVGRLDKDTSGLLLLTNDTHFSNALTDPVSGIPKTYLAKINFHPSAEQLRLLEEGVVLSSGERTLPARVCLLRATDKYAYLKIVLVEGKNRQIRRMIKAINGTVLKLVRTQIGELSLGDLQIGKYRLLDAGDLKKLRNRAPDPDQQQRSQNPRADLTT